MHYPFQTALRAGFRADIGANFRTKIILLNCPPGLHRPARVPLRARAEDPHPLGDAPLREGGLGTGSQVGGKNLGVHCKLQYTLSLLYKDAI